MYDKLISSGVKKRGENLDEEIASSEDTKMSSIVTVDDSSLNNEDQLKELQLKYIYAYILKRMEICPQTECATTLPMMGLVPHILKVHKAVPKYIMELKQYGEVNVNLGDLDHGKSCCILALFIRIYSNKYDVSDRTTMPLMVMAAKINPCGLLVFDEPEDEPEDEPDTPEMELMSPGELLMIWICGHLQSLSSTIRVKAAHKVTNQYAGTIHAIAKNNVNPYVVFARGNCLIIPAHNVMELTQNGKVPLKLEVQLSEPEE